MSNLSHTLQQANPGMIWLDKEGRITGMNGRAKEFLGSMPEGSAGQDILAMHPAESRDKVRLLIGDGGEAADAPPATMMINTPQKVLLVKASPMMGEGGFVGHSVVLYDVTNQTLEPRGTDDGERRLFKLPVAKQNQVLLVDLEDVALIQADGRYTQLFTADETYFCNLSLSTLEKRLDADQFPRTHRSYLINLKKALAFEREDDQAFVRVDHGGGYRVPVSRNRVADLKARLGLG